MRAKLRTLPLPRYVEAASIDEGDVIRAVWKVGDVEHARTGRVGRVINDGATKTFVTPDGNEIARTTRGTKRVRFTLLEEAPMQESEPLFTMDTALQS